VLNHSTALRRESATFYATADSADPAARVPGCPDWSVADLVWHLAEVHYFWGTVVEKQIVDASALESIERRTRPGQTNELIAYGRQMAERLASALDVTDPSTPVWTWSIQQDVGFIARHQVQEAAVHRWDIESAGWSGPSPIDAEVAADSVDEFLRLCLPAFRGGTVSLPGSVHLHCIDTDGEWVIHQDGRVDAAHARADAALRASASDLLLALYRRVPLDAVQVVGDRTVAEALVAGTDLT
jgi:uncharacterized protein (TIGR03083 family)